ncbi:MAG: helix-turn-helix domain-containing protein [Oscillospiraceae bacterium]|nr:helix-turn-helix domain-containing protein [Oscillospiraceae bacterium]
MDDIKTNVAKNIAQLRGRHGVTQAELAEKLNYSDKAVSKWERGESVPDVSVLLQIAELFGVSLDYMVCGEHPADEVKTDATGRRMVYNHGFITGMAILLVWLIAMLVFVVIEIAYPAAKLHWLAFVIAAPVSLVVWLVLNAVWFNRKRNYLIISLLMWAVLAAIFVTFIAVGKNVWLIFLLGIPGQIIILMWSRLNYKKP